MAAARRKRALTPYRLSAATKAIPSGGRDVFAFRYSSIAQADAPLTDNRFVSSVIARPGWYVRARGMRASAIGTTTVISRVAASKASVRQGRRIEVTMYHVRLMATWSHDRKVSIGVWPTTRRGQDAQVRVSALTFRRTGTVNQLPDLPIGRNR